MAPTHHRQPRSLRRPSKPPASAQPMADSLPATILATGEEALQLGSSEAEFLEVIVQPWIRYSRSICCVHKLFVLPICVVLGLTALPGSGQEPPLGFDPDQAQALRLADGEELVKPEPEESSFGFSVASAGAHVFVGAPYAFVGPRAEPVTGSRMPLPRAAADRCRVHGVGRVCRAGRPGCRVGARVERSRRVMTAVCGACRGFSQRSIWSLGVSRSELSCGRSGRV